MQREMWSTKLCDTKYPSNLKVFKSSIVEKTINIMDPGVTLKNNKHCQMPNVKKTFAKAYLQILL